MADFHIGCSGFNYSDWRGKFYPEGLPEKEWLSHYCSIFRSVELNVTFYRLLKPETFHHWRLITPADFRFCIKGSRFITHIKRLADPEEPLERFFDGALHLGDKLRVVLWQFPPGFACSTGRLERFLTLLSRYPVHHALEFRNESWCTEQIATLCREHHVALCMADWPAFDNELPVTSDFVYLRRHGHQGNYATCYTSDELRADASRINSYLAKGLAVYTYFNNDANAFAPANALELVRLLAGEQ